MKKKPIYINYGNLRIKFGGNKMDNKIKKAFEVKPLCDKKKRKTLNDIIKEKRGKY